MVQKAKSRKFEKNIPFFKDGVLCFLPCCFSLSAGRGVFFRVFPVIFLRAFMFLFSRGVRCARQVFCVSVV